MLCFPNAKLNLGLQIIRRRSDGYHNISSCFVPIGWSDILEILPAEQLSFRSTGIEIPDDGMDNLCLRAYHLLNEDHDLPPVKIHLHKILPIGAGLGGGSSDASHTLKALNTMLDLDLDAKTLQGYASRLGSDCAFFIQNEAMHCIGVGDVMHPIALDLSQYYIVVVFPDLFVSTQEAYSQVVPAKPSKTIDQILQMPIHEWKDYLHNDFENSLFALYPRLAEVKDDLYQAGALYASMTGSGSTCFGIFDKEIEIDFPKNYLIWKSIKTNTLDLYK